LGGVIRFIHETAAFMGTIFAAGRRITVSCFFQLPPSRMRRVDSSSLELWIPTAVTVGSHHLGVGVAFSTNR
jgi:hypothetical protein